MVLTREEFETALSEAVAAIPPRFANLIQNVAIEIEDEPTFEEQRKTKPGLELLGLYRGVPLTLRGSSAPVLPDRITIYRGPICRAAHSHEEILAEIRDTIIHEIGHYFGLTDEEMPHHEGVTPEELRDPFRPQERKPAPHGWRQFAQYTFAAVVLLAVIAALCATYVYDSTPHPLPSRDAACVRQGLPPSCCNSSC